MSRIHYKNLCAFPGRTGEPFLTEFTVENGIFIADDSPAPDGTEIVTIDMRGAFVMPAFIDAHAHPDGLAMTMGAAACTPPTVRSIPELQSALRKRAGLKAGGMTKVSSLRAAHRSKMTLIRFQLTGLSSSGAPTITQRS